jgi:hypothetical protein
MDKTKHQATTRKKKKQKYNKGNQQYRKKHTMQITAAKRKLIACKPKTEAEGDIRSSSRWGCEKRLGSGQWAAKRTRRRSAAHTKQFGGGEFK